MHTFPTGFIEYGHPPNPPIDESTVLHPSVAEVNIFYIALSKVS